MASSHSYCPPKPIRFFKIVLSDIGSHSELAIPAKFARIFEKNLDDTRIFLNAPSGSLWSIDLERHKDKVWLQNGWPEFAKHYSIGFGYVLVFEYMGDSKFQVLIFDPSSSEIDYSLASGEKLNFAGSTHVKKRVIDIDDLTSSDDEVRPCKKMKTNSPCIDAKLQQEAKGNGDGALASAKAFKSKNPFFIQFMKPSNILHRRGLSVYVTRTFEVVYKNWKNNDKVILQVAGRTWAVYCSLDLDSNQCRIRRGWINFVRDNSLNVCDVCVFELINRAEKLFQVIIYRATKERNCEKNRRSPRVKSEAEDARVLASISVKKPSASSSCIEAFRKGPKLQLENENGDGESASNKDKDRALASAQAFKSKNPFFIIVMQPFHVNGGGTGLYITKTFKESYEKWKNHDEVIFQVAGRTWQVYCNLNSDLNQCRISRGWTGFARENSMNVGDVCVFELINPSRKLLEVFIFRSANETNFKGNKSLPRIRSRAKKLSRIRSKADRLSRKRSKPEQARVHTSVDAFKSKNPFFTFKVYPSYLYGGSMIVRKSFEGSYKNWNDNDKVHLQVAGKIWQVKCDMKWNRCRLSSGWDRFAQENSLNVDDVCVFELIDACKKLLQVIIFRATKETNEDGESKSKVQALASTSSDKVVEFRKKRRVTSLCLKSGLKKPNLQQERANVNGELASKVEEDKALACAQAFKSENPLFILTMKPHLIDGTGRPYVPRTFKEAYENWKHNDQIILHVPGRTLPVYCTLKLHIGRFRISPGWGLFVQDNSLNVGDVCVFELIIPSRKLFQVSIFRATDEAEKAPVLTSKAVMS